MFLMVYGGGLNSITDSKSCSFGSVGSTPTIGIGDLKKTLTEMLGSFLLNYAM